MKLGAFALEKKLTSRKSRTHKPVVKIREISETIVKNETALGREELRGDFGHKIVLEKYTNDTK